MFARRFCTLSGLFVIVCLAAGCMTVNLDNRSASTPAVMPTAASAALATPAAATVTPTPIAPSPTATAQPTATSTPVPPTATSHVVKVSQPRRPMATPTSQPPSIISFVADRLEVDPGESVTLSWNTSGADQIMIYPNVPDGRYLEGIHVAPSGSLTIPTDKAERLWYQFTLYAYNDNGGDTAQGSITVRLRCPYTFFFGPLSEEDQQYWACPDGPATFSAAVEQAFEHGRMIWLQATQTVYVFLDDGTLLSFADTWSEGQPEKDPQIVSPEGRSQPVRGFGKVWRTATYYGTSLRDQVGWALAPEKGFDGALQGTWLRCCSQPTTAYRPIYLRSLDGRILRLWFNEVAAGTWKYATP